MSVLKMLMSGARKRIYIDDVFSTYLYEGNGSTQDIVNGIDLAGEGGMVWFKSRSNLESHCIIDTIRGDDTYLKTDTAGLEVTATPDGNLISSFNSDGFSLGSSSYNGLTNYNGGSFTSWTFRKAPRFFDIVKYTGIAGADNRDIPHSLVCSPGMIIAKRTDNSGTWGVYHRSQGYTKYSAMETTNAFSVNANIWGGEPTDTVFTVNNALNENNAEYIAYLFAHDPLGPSGDGSDGMIACGSFTTDASGNYDGSDDLGWEAQLMDCKCSSATSNWDRFDSMRGLVVGGNDSVLSPNLQAAEVATSDNIDLTATGFIAKGYQANQTYIYMAIRRPNKPPESASEVFAVDQGDGVSEDPTFTSNFPVDMGFYKNITAEEPTLFTRLSSSYLKTSSSVAENQVSWLGFDNMDGVLAVARSADFYSWMFRRAPGFFTCVADTGTGSAHTIAHDLAVPPELWLRKSRSAATQWVWGSSLLANTEKIVMPSPAGKVTDATAWNSTYPTSSVISLGTSADVNTNTATYITYVWATLAGISKVGLYTGDGASQTINCGFAAGARLIMIIRTTASTSQDIFIWDSVRGIVSGNDPHLSLNTTAAEVTTDDSVDPDASGFIVNQVAATNINVLDAEYIFYAIA